MLLLAAVAVGRPGVGCADPGNLLACLLTLSGLYLLWEIAVGIIARQGLPLPSAGDASRPFFITRR